MQIVNKPLWQAAPEERRKHTTEVLIGASTAWWLVWVPAERNGNDDECSFDSATEWAMPDGSRKITYTCCY